MNNDPTLRSAANQPSRPDRDRDAGHATDMDQAPAEESSRQQPSSADAALKHKAGLAKKLQFMSHLMHSLDMLVFAEICTLYYMECSFPRLLLRVAPHYFFLTPKSEDFFLLLPAHRAHVFAIFVPNLMCMLLHLLLPLPLPAQMSRGYLHGGVIVDFIGQKPPSSRLVLLLLDLFVVALQCVMLAVHHEREKLRMLVLPGRQGNAAAAVRPVPAQDHDAEERGVRRDGTGISDEADEVELRSLPDGRGATREGQEGAGLLDRSSSGRAVASDLTSLLRSGNAVLGDFHVIHAIRVASEEQQNTPADPSQPTGYTAALAALAAERRARLQAHRRQ